MSHPTPLAPLPLADRFALLIQGLCRTAAARMARNPAIVPLMLIAWGRLQRMVARFARLAARVAAGTLAPRRTAAPPARRPQGPRQRLPEGFAWLVRLVPEAAVSGTQLHHLLADPEMVALLGAAPRVGRILRPLCHMLGAEPVAALLPPPPPRQRAAPACPRQPPAPRPHQPPGTAAASRAALFDGALPGLGSFRLPRRRTTS